jgi:predicted nuclease with TOPRIM domain
MSLPHIRPLDAHSIRSDLSTYARREETEMEDFEADLDTLRVRRGALEEQLKKGGPDARLLQDQLRDIDAQIAVLEEAIANEDASRDA